MRQLRIVWIVRTLSLGMLFGSLPGCAPTPGAVCSPGLGPPILVFSLFFGRAVAARNDVNESMWQRFRDDTITPNLPNGYTVLDATGAWMNPMTHETMNEASRMIIAALPVSSSSLAAVNRIRTEYQVRFRQLLVGMAVAHECGSF